MRGRPGEDRFWEIDLIRGLLVLGMATYHAFFDLHALRGWADPAAGPLLALARSVAFGFVLLAGAALYLSFLRQEIKGRPPPLSRSLARGSRIFGWGMLVTLATWIYPREGFVIFGVLHLIGISIVLCRPFLGLPQTSLLVGTAAVAIGAALDGLPGGSPWLIPLGLPPAGFYSLDYLPILPWTGVFLIGTSAAAWAYPGYRRRFRLPAWAGRLPETRPGRCLIWLGQHSLAAYLLHQPALACLILLLIPSS